MGITLLDSVENSPTPNCKLTSTYTRTIPISMTGQKRASEIPDVSNTSREFKKQKVSAVESAKLTIASSLLTEEVDFPRGGGTTFTPSEVKKIRIEAIKEADKELFEVCWKSNPVNISDRA
jgi:hypothetical protein